MFVSPFFAVMALLIQWPQWTEGAFDELKEWEKNQIALDNAAIRIGQGERSFRQWVEGIRRQLSRLERVHHLVHDCARLPQTAAKCLPLDRAVEAKLQSVRLRWQLQAPIRWRSVEVTARAEARRLHRQLELQRPGDIPFQLVRCPRCHQRVRIRAQRRFPWRSQLELASHPVQVQVLSDKENYQIQTGEK